MPSITQLNEALGNWGRALVRTDIDNSEVAFLTRAFNTTKEEIALETTKTAARLEKIEAAKPKMTASAASAAKVGGYVCYKCSGFGKIRGFAHIENGTCFPCGGTGVYTPKNRKKKR